MGSQPVVRRCQGGSTAVGCQGVREQVEKYHLNAQLWRLACFCYSEKRPRPFYLLRVSTLVGFHSVVCRIIARVQQTQLLPIADLGHQTNTVSSDSTVVGASNLLLLTCTSASVTSPWCGHTVTAVVHYSYNTSLDEQVLFHLHSPLLDFQSVVMVILKTPALRQSFAWVTQRCAYAALRRQKRVTSSGWIRLMPKAEIHVNCGNQSMHWWAVVGFHHSTPLARRSPSLCWCEAGRCTYTDCWRTTAVVLACSAALRLARIPQGPILSLVYTADLLILIETYSLRPHAYAHDTQMYGFCSPTRCPSASFSSIQTVASRWHWLH